MVNGAKKKPRKVIPLIVVTGGPCGGKTKGLQRLRERLPELGITPITVEEVATRLFARGFKSSILASNPELWRTLQETILKEQLSAEKATLKLARNYPAENVVIICDRGAVDGMAYINPEDFEKVLRRCGYSTLQDLRNRYTAVFHLVTAAIGAEKHYNVRNPERTENVPQAVTQDRKTLQAWNGHEHLFILRNRENGVPVGFQRKLSNLVAAVCQVLKKPVPIEIEKKYLITPADEAPDGSAVSRIYQVYLKSADPEVERRVRKKLPVGAPESEATYFYTEKTDLGDSNGEERGENERIITQEEFEAYLREKDTNAKPISKTRHSFLYNDQYFHLDFFDDPILVILEIELTDRRQIPELPPNLRVIKEITGDKRYYNHGIATGLCPGYNNKKTPS